MFFHNGLDGAMVARLIPSQKVASSSLVRVKVFFFSFFSVFFFQFFFFSFLSKFSHFPVTA